MDALKPYKKYFPYIYAAAHGLLAISTFLPWFVVAIDFGFQNVPGFVNSVSLWSGGVWGLIIVLLSGFAMYSMLAPIYLKDIYETTLKNVEKKLPMTNLVLSGIAFAIVILVLLQGLGVGFGTSIGVGLILGVLASIAALIVSIAHYKFVTEENLPQEDSKKAAMPTEPKDKPENPTSEKIDEESSVPPKEEQNK